MDVVFALLDHPVVQTLMAQAALGVAGYFAFFRKKADRRQEREEANNLTTTEWLQREEVKERERAQERIGMEKRFEELNNRIETMRENYESRLAEKDKAMSDERKRTEIEKQDMRLQIRDLSAEVRALRHKLTNMDTGTQIATEIDALTEKFKLEK